MEFVTMDNNADAVLSMGFIDKTDTVESLRAR